MQIHNTRPNSQPANRQVSAVSLLLLTLTGLAAVFLLCGGGALALLGLAQLAGQPGTVSAALQTSPAQLQALGRQFLQGQGYASSGLGLLMLHSGLWLVPVLALCLCAGVAGFAWWRYHAAKRRWQALQGALIVWLKGGAFTPPAFCPESLQEAVAAHTEQQVNDLHAARKQAEDADCFAQNIYHQIKTPLAAAQLLLEQIEAAPKPGAIQTAGRCRAELDKISTLTHTLLQEGRFDSGTVALHWQPEDLEILAEDAIAELQPLCQSKGVSVQLEIPDAADVHTVLCDAFWLGEALGNILKNCIEQTPAGNTIRLKIEYNATQTHILVFDPGSFLPEDTDIFARYATTRADGVGIGLHLARQITRAHFGTLTAYNCADGCEFCLTLPVLQGSVPYRKQTAPTVTEL